MDDILRIYFLLSHSNGLKIREISQQLELDRLYVTEIMLSDEGTRLWYQNDSLLWFAKEGAIQAEEPRKDELAKPKVAVSQTVVERYADLSENASLHSYMKMILAFPTYSYEETMRLFERYHDDDEQAFELLVHSNLKLVVNLARFYRHRGVPLEDLIQEGNLGLIRAIHKFDYIKSTSFIEYAKAYILQAIHSALLVLPYTVGIAPSVVIKHYRLHRLMDLQEQELGFEPPIDEELAEPILASKNVDIYNRLPYDLLTLTQTADCDTFESNGPLTDDTLMTESEKADVESLLAQIMPRARSVLQEYFGIGCMESTLNEIGRLRNLSHERVRQIKESAIRRLRPLHKEFVNNEFQNIGDSSWKDRWMARKSEKQNLKALKKAKDKPKKEKEKEKKKGRTATRANTLISESYRLAAARNRWILDDSRVHREVPHTWTETDDWTLRNLYRSGSTVSRLAQVFNVREKEITIGAIFLS